MIKHYCDKCRSILVPYNKKYCKSCSIKVSQYRHSKLNQNYMQFMNTGKWKRLRREIKSERPMCERCVALHKQGKKETVNPTESIHHIKKVRDYPELKLNKKNLKALCNQCHKYYTDKGL